MFKTVLKHKKGFTLVELIVVMTLMGFGVVALANLFQSGIRTYNEQEERYIKQEMVKSVVEYLQNTNISTATKAEIYPKADVVPVVAGIDLSYSYLYVEPADVTGDGTCDGYYLYKLERGQGKADAVCLNPDTPLYITFNAYRDYDYVGAEEIKNQCGIKVEVAAVDSDFDYGTVESPNVPSDDQIFYSIPVSYHFANMVESSDSLRVNWTGSNRDTANTHNESGKTSVVVNSVDEDGQVLRITSDSTISSDSANVPISVSSFCFIATAGYGEATGEVGILCDFRDEVLMTNPLGRMFTKAYYAISPEIADFISDKEPLKAAVRVALKPLVSFAAYTLNPELITENIPSLVVAVASLGGMLGVGIRVHKKKKEE